MEEPFHVPAVAKSDRIAAFVGVPCFLAFAALEVLVGLPWAAPFFVAAAGGSVWTTWRWSRLARRGVVLDDEGLGPAEDGERVWTLSWSQYGGFRRTTATLWERFRYPERNGYEILGRDGQPRFYLLSPSGNTAHATFNVAIRHELRRRLPEGLPDPSAPASKPPRKAFVAVTTLIALFGGVLAFVGLANPAGPFFGLGMVGGFVGLGAAFAAVFEGVALVRWSRGWRPKPLALPALPEEGPALSRHLALRSRRPLKLEEGGRYRTVDPQRTRRQWGEMAKVCAFLAWTCGLAAVALTCAVGARFDPVGLLLATLFLAFSLFARQGARTYRTLLAGVDDVLWVHEDRLIVVRANGETVSLPLPAVADQAAVRRREAWGYTDAWPLLEGGRYLVDRTRLYAAPMEVEP